MQKHGISHGLAVLFTSVTSAFFIDMLRPKFPSLVNIIDNISLTVITLFHIPLSPRALSVIIIAVVLSYFWGIIFKLLHKD